MNRRDWELPIVAAMWVAFIAVLVYAVIWARS